MGAFSNIKGLSYYGDNADDPYVSFESVSLFLSLLQCRADGGANCRNKKMKN